MKPKHFEKKLVLSKMTISNLNVNEMLAIMAGAQATGQDTCLTEYDSRCPTHCYTDDGHTGCKPAGY
jgi:hypothetical protein